MNVAAVRKHRVTCQIPLACRLALSAPHLSISITGQRARTGGRRSGENTPVSRVGTAGCSRYNRHELEQWAGPPQVGDPRFGRVEEDFLLSTTFKPGNSRQVIVAERSTAVFSGRMSKTRCDQETLNYWEGGKGHNQEKTNVFTTKRPPLSSYNHSLLTVL